MIESVFLLSLARGIVSGAFVFQGHGAKERT
jgi:hypothetical protein